MNIREQLLLVHSKNNAENIADYIGNDQTRFSELITQFTGDDPKVSGRAGMVLSKCADRHPALIDSYLKELILNLKKPVSDAVKRNTVRILQKADLPEELLGTAADILFSIMENRNEPVAVRVFTMTTLYNICVKFPELANELKLLIEDQMPYGSTGFKNRGAKTLSKLSRLIK